MGDGDIDCQFNPCYSANRRGTAAANKGQVQLGKDNTSHAMLKERSKPSVDRNSQVHTSAKTNSRTLKPVHGNVSKKLIVFFVCTAIMCAIISIVALVVSVWIAYTSILMDTVANQGSYICQQNVSKSNMEQRNQSYTTNSGHESNGEILSPDEMFVTEDQLKSHLDRFNATFTIQFDQAVLSFSEMFVTLDQLKDFFLPRISLSECGPGLWRKVAYVNMTLPSHQCPSAWREYTSPVRTCGRLSSSTGNCASAIFKAYGVTYTRVCGRVIGYQWGTPNAFLNLGRPEPTSVDENYVDGISVTHGTPRTHIWTFAAGRSTRSDGNGACPCDNPASAPSSPSFISNNYFCESGGSSVPDEDEGSFVVSNKLWDGTGCTSGTCCSFNSPPWFSVELPSSTTDDIEVRICADERTGNEDMPIELLEIYVQ